MFAAFDEVPFYPLAFPLFWGAVADLRAPDGAPPAGVRGGAHRRRRRTTRPPRLWGSIRYALVQMRMFRDPPAGLMHSASSGAS